MSFEKRNPPKSHYGIDQKDQCRAKASPTTLLFLPSKLSKNRRSEPSQLIDLPHSRQRLTGLTGFVSGIKKKAERKSGLRPAVGERGLYAGGLNLSTAALRNQRHFLQRTKQRCISLLRSPDIVARRSGFKSPLLTQIPPAGRSCHKADTFSRD